MRKLVLVIGTLALAIALPRSPARGHAERQIESPARSGSVPDIDRVNPTRLVVCKPSSRPTQAQLTEIRARQRTTEGDTRAQAEADERTWMRNQELFDECAYAHIQDAVNAAGNDTDILVLPGVYLEEPSRAAPTSSRGDLPDGSYSYEYHAAHPNDANLIAVLGKTNITIEGTGAEPQDVLIDAGFVKDVGVRCDRCTGFIIRNLWESDANEHGIYVVDSDGYIFDRTIGSYNGEYELFGFASDHGLFTDCEAVGGGDSGIYVGGAPITPGRFAAEIRRCVMRHNALGFSGTQGSYIWMHHNEATDNAIGISFDSENDHPNFPQRASLIENNDFHDNNFDIYAATSDVPARGPAYNFFRYPIGTGLWIVGGEDNIIRNNRVYNNGRFGFIVAGNALEMPLPAEVNRNAFYDNLMGADAGNGAGPNGTVFPPGGDFAAGGTDFFWDETGNDNCWGPNGNSTTNPDPIPGPCPASNTGNIAPEGDKLDVLLSCLLIPDPDDPTKYVTADAVYPCPWGHENLGGYESGDQVEGENGAIDLGEQCDPGAEEEGEEEVAANLNGETCASLGAGGGTLGCADGNTWDFSGCTGPKLAATISPTQTDIDVDDPSSLPASGTLKIHDEVVSYSGKSATGLMGVTRGVDGTISASHAVGSPLTEQATETTASDGCAVNGGHASGWTALLLIPAIFLAAARQRRRMRR